MIPIEDVVCSDYPHLESDLEVIIGIHQEYRKYKSEQHFFDFDDLLVYLQQLLKTHPDIRDRISSSYCYICGKQDSKTLSAGNCARSDCGVVSGRLSFLQMPLAKLGEAVIKHYLPILKGKYDNHPKRAKDLEQLLAIMERYSDLSLFLTDMALEPPDTSIGDTFSAASDTPADNRLTLSTIHAAKGLEWHTVFIIWALVSRFPSPHALYKEEELEEELRLRYVAATRARKNLIFTYPNQVYDRMMGMLLDRPSRFTDMIQLSVLEKQSARFLNYDT